MCGHAENNKPVLVRVALPALYKLGESGAVEVR